MVGLSLMEDSLLDPAKEDRRKIRSLFTTFAEEEQPALPAGPPVVTDPNANPFPDVPLPSGFREAPLPPIRRKEEPAVGDLTSDIEDELDRHEREAR